MCGAQVSLSRELQRRKSTFQSIYTKKERRKEDKTRIGLLMTTGANAYVIENLCPVFLDAHLKLCLVDYGSNKVTHFK